MLVRTDFAEGVSPEPFIGPLGEIERHPAVLDADESDLVNGTQFGADAVEVLLFKAEPIAAFYANSQVTNLPVHKPISLIGDDSHEITQASRIAGTATARTPRRKPPRPAAK